MVCRKEVSSFTPTVSWPTQSLFSESRGSSWLFLYTCCLWKEWEGNSSHKRLGPPLLGQRVLRLGLRSAGGIAVPRLVAPAALHGSGPVLMSRAVGPGASLVGAGIGAWQGAALFPRPALCGSCSQSRPTPVAPAWALSSPTLWASLRCWLFLLPS